ncbi:MAG: tetratricopeptide repeat protein [Desulfobulbaceae bacterium]|nr:tetratricopeptide repeat protein [Desulfobulbaceae bacterium]
MEVLQENGRNRPGAVELMFATHPMSEERYQTARNAAQSTYRDMLSGSDNRERYMDNTAGLRRIKDAISGLQRANGLLNKKKYEQARQELASALKIAPNDYAALVMMSKCRFALKHTPEAERYALKASKVYPQEAQAHVITGVTSIMQKKYGQAYQQFSEYDKLLPGNPEITFFKGYSLEGMQRREESAGEYSSYLRKVNRGEKAQHAYNRLKTWGYVR